MLVKIFVTHCKHPDLNIYGIVYEEYWVHSQDLPETLPENPGDEIFDLTLYDPLLVGHEFMAKDACYVSAGVLSARSVRRLS